jgi:hypothetical protein
MPRYFFNVNGAVHSSDDDGEEFPDDKAAWKEATLVAGEMFRDIDGKFQPGQEWNLEVTDAERRPLYRIAIKGNKCRD